MSKYCVHPAIEGYGRHLAHHLKPCVCGHAKKDHGSHGVCWVNLFKEPEGCMCIEYRSSTGSKEMDAWYAAGLTEVEAMERGN